MTETKNHAAFIWSLADLLRCDYKQSEYGKLILPLTVFQALKASGRRLGRPVEQNAETMARIAAEHADGRSLRSIAAGLTADKVPTARGGLWHASTIKRVLASVELDEQAAA